MADGGAQFTKWLSLGGNVNSGPSVFYDEVDPFQGQRRALSARVGLANSKLNHSFSYLVHFERRDTGEKVYDVSHRQPSQHLPVHAAIPHAGDRAIRQLAASGAR